MKVENVSLERRQVLLGPEYRRVDALADDLLSESRGVALLVARDQAPAIRAARDTQVPAEAS